MAASSTRHLPDDAGTVLLHRRPIACWSSWRGCSASTSGLIEAALDLGATHVQAFRKILLPFLRPAIVSAAVIAFLASFENYNTSVFTLAHYTTFTVVVAQKVRFGIDPSISALAVIIIGLTLFAALVREAYAGRGRPDRGAHRPPRRHCRQPRGSHGQRSCVGAVAVVGFAVRHDPAACKAAALEQRLERQRQFAPAGDRPAPDDGTGTGQPAAPRYQPRARLLRRHVAPGICSHSAAEAPATGRREGGFGDLFAPGQPQAGRRLPIDRRAS